MSAKTIDLNQLQSCCPQAAAMLCRSAADYPITGANPLPQNAMINMVHREKGLDGLVTATKEKKVMERVIAAGEVGFDLKGGVISGKVPREIKCFWSVNVDGRPTYQLAKHRDAKLVVIHLLALSVKASIGVVYRHAEKPKLLLLPKPKPAEVPAE